MSNERKNPKSNRPARKLSDTQLTLLSAAAQRDDLCLTVTPTAKGRAVGKVIEKLIAASLVKEIIEPRPVRRSGVAMTRMPDHML
jgi:hypothetical protein